MMMYTLIYMTLLTTSGWAADEKGKCSEAGKGAKSHTKAECTGDGHTLAEWKKDKPAPITEKTNKEDIKTKGDFKTFKEKKNWCSAEACAHFTGKWEGSSWKYGLGEKGQYVFESEGCQAYIKAMEDPPRFGDDGWKQEYEYEAVGARSRSTKVKELLMAWNQKTKASDAKLKSLKKDMDNWEKAEAYLAYCFTSKKQADEGTGTGNKAHVGVAVFGGLALYALYWIPGLWYPAALTLLGGATALYSSTNMIQMASRISRNETELITSNEYMETIGLAGCLGCSVLVWICTQLSRTGFNFFGVPGFLS